MSDRHTRAEYSAGARDELNKSEQRMSDGSASEKGKRPKRRRPALTLQQIKFAEIYVEKGNATEAYLAAGFTAGSRDSAHVMAWRLLRNHAVQDLIHTLREEAWTRPG